MKIPTEKNQKLKEILDRVNEHTELKTLWEVINVNAMQRLGYSDHGPVHFQIVANIGLRLCRMLHEHDTQMNIEKNYDMAYDDAEVIVFLASIMHDLGMTINRDGHEGMSLFLANKLLPEVLGNTYDIRERTIIISEVLHAIIAHRSNGKVLTLEAGIVRVADALDMAEGRSRLSFDAGHVDIHSVSALAISKVEIKQGDSKPIKIVVSMENSAGIFQIDDLFHSKIKGSGLEQYISLSVVNEADTEKKIIQKYTIE